MDKKKKITTWKNIYYNYKYLLIIFFNVYKNLDIHREVIFFRNLHQNQND